MTPIAWKIPGSMMENRLDGSPLRSGDTSGPSNMTEATMMIIPQSAKLDAMDSLWMSRYSDSGYETQIVQKAIMNRRSAKR